MSPIISPMDGPAILTRSLSVPATKDESGNAWQYHSRSDRHSKIACWAVLFDLLQQCALFREHVRVRKVGFGINHTMNDFSTGRRKDLDLVVCTPGAGDTSKKAVFSELVQTYGIELDPRERSTLAALPELIRVPVGSVHLALEAKAVMTSHIKALPRLYDELNSSHLAIHGSSDFAIAAGFVMVNMSDSFLSSDRNKFPIGSLPAIVSRHRQPNDCQRALDKLREVPRRPKLAVEGFDAVGVVVVRCCNDGTPVTVVTEAPAPATDDILHYDAMVRRIAHVYEGRFAAL